MLKLSLLRAGRHYKTFEESRRFAQSLNLSTVREWLQYWRAHKPAGIPCRPERYPDFRGYPDFLGYTYPSGVNAAAKGRWGGLSCQQTLTEIRGASLVESALSDRFELVKLPGLARASFLARPLSQEDRWVPLAIAASSQVKSKHRWRVTKPSTERQSVEAEKFPRIFVDTSQQRLFVETPTFAEKWKSCQNGRKFSVTLDDVDEVQTSADLQSHVLEVWKSVECRSLAELTDRLDHTKHAQLVHQLVRQLYEPAGLAFEFPKKVYRGFVNGIVGGRRVVQRRACNARAGSSDRLIVRLFASGSVPLHPQDPIDFLIAPLFDEDEKEIRGVYIFPQRYLFSNNRLRWDGEKPKYSIYLRNPNIPARGKRGRELQLLESQYYVDFSDADYVAKALRIFSEHHDTPELE